MRETLYAGARVFTGDRASGWGDCISVRGQWIHAVGFEQDMSVLRGSGTEVVDLGGRVVVPGFIDAHNHYLATAEALTSVDLRYPGVASVADLVDAIAVRAGQTPAGSWIRGFGMDYAKYPDPRFPTRWDLDRATGDHPVIAYHVSGHYALVNSAALAHRGIDDNVANPAGGEFVRDADGRAHRPLPGRGHQPDPPGCRRRRLARPELPHRGAARGTGRAARCRRPGLPRRRSHHRLRSAGH